MTATESRKTSVSRKSMAGQALFVILLLLIARYLWMRDQPERLMNAPSYAYKISGEYLYHQSPPGDLYTALPGQPTIQAQSIRGGALRTIAQEDPRYQFLNGGGNVLDTLRVAAGEIYYEIVPRPKSTKVQDGIVSGFAAGDAPTGEDLGTFLLPPKSASGVKTAGLKRVYMDQSSFPAREIRIRQVAMQGGTPRDVATLKDSGYAIVGDHVFWIRRGGGRWAAVTQDNGSDHPAHWTEIDADNDLMLTSLADGTTRCICHGMSGGLTVGEAGITWEQPAPFPGLPTVFYARVSDGSVRALGALQKMESMSPVFEAGGQLYWAATFKQSSSYTALIRANLDGTGVHEVSSQVKVNRHPIASLSLHTYQGNLYGCVAAPEDPGKPRKYVCRFRPERSDPLEIVHKLPDATGYEQFDGDYLYFVQGETKRSLWAVLTNDETGAEVTTSFCRVSLDH